MNKLSVIYRHLPKALVLLLMTGLFSCSRLEEQEKPLMPENTDQPQADEKVFIGYTPSAEEATKTGLDAQAKMFWQTGDRIAIFRSSTNERYRFNGEDGDIWSEFVKDDSTVPGEAFTKNYALYPWADEVASATEGTITFNFPATQPYAVNTFAQNANPMMAVTASSSVNELKFQNLCGFVQLRLYGEGKVRRIRFYGNNNEVLCGTATVTAAYGSEPGLAMDGDEKVLTLDCGEEGVVIGSEAEDYTSFWLVIPPTVFTKGFTFEIEFVNTAVSTKSTDKNVTIARNHVLPISALKVEQAPKEITAFSLSDGVHSYEAFEINDNIISVQVPNGADLNSLVASFTYEGVNVKVGEVVQESGVTANDFSDFAAPLEYIVVGWDASVKTYTIRLFDLPVVTVETPNHQAIIDKENWIPLEDKGVQQTVITIRQTKEDGTVTLDQYTAQVKGRGNSSWRQPKKPYAIKLNKKAEILGMAKHKRWCLLNSCCKYYISNPIGYELGRRTTSMAWAPSGRYVDLILNGEHLGCYLLAEQIKIDENRVNITEMSSSDISGEAVTGGYLLTYDNTWDERYKFKTEYYNMPVMFKDPDPDPDKGEGTLPVEQLNYVKDYINTLEASLKDPDRLAAREYTDYIDVDTYVDQWFVWEIAGISDMHNHSDFVTPRSVWYHKDRGGKLTAGPVWDFDGHFFRNKSFTVKNCQYYGTLFTEPGFVARVKEKWPEYKERLEANEGMVAFVDSVYNVVKNSARRDWVIWADAVWSPSSYGSTYNVDQQYSIIRAGLPAKINWLDQQIAAMVVTYDNKGAGTEDFSDQQNPDFGFEF